MAVTHGMNTDEVENFGRKLQTHYAPAIEDVMRQVEQLVNQTSATWVGPDAERFRSW